MTASPSAAGRDPAGRSWRRAWSGRCGAGGSSWRCSRACCWRGGCWPARSGRSPPRVPGGRGRSRGCWRRRRARGLLARTLQATAAAAPVPARADRRRPAARGARAAAPVPAGELARDPGRVGRVDRGPRRAPRTAGGVDRAARAARHARPRRRLARHRDLRAPRPARGHELGAVAARQRRGVVAVGAGPGRRRRARPGRLDRAGGAQHPARAASLAPASPPRSRWWSRRRRLDPSVRLWLLDGKLVELSAWAPCARRLAGPDVGDAIELLREIREEMEQRYRDDTQPGNAAAGRGWDRSMIVQAV